MGQGRGHSGSGAKVTVKDGLPGFALCIYMVSPFVETGHTLGRFDLRFEFGGPLPRGKVITGTWLCRGGSRSLSSSTSRGHGVTQVALQTQHTLSSEGLVFPETEADDVSSPEGSPVPLPWLSRHSHRLGLSDEELDETPGSPEVDLAGESSTELECEDQGDPSPPVTGQGPARGWVASIKQGSNYRPSEHPEAQPSVEHSRTKSWSSATVGLGQPSDSLGSTWEGDTNVPQPATLPEALPQSPCHNLLHPDDRNEGDVAPATPTEFRDSLAAPARNPECSAGTWGRETTSLPSSRPEDQSWKRTKASPKPLPSRFTGSVSPLSTRLGAVNKVVSQHKQGATVAGHSSSRVPKYGRGRLNYPLPDFSKVGPRVRFPKDENYRPPKSRGHNRQQGSTRPLIFKSPAEIVRDVLLSSGDTPLAKESSLAHPITRVPQEFQTPEQATELVHQLQVSKALVHVTQTLVD